jgi:hypothetical protein
LDEDVCAGLKHDGGNEWGLAGGQDMASTGSRSSESKLVSPLGALVVGLTVGAGVVLILHAKRINGLQEELVRTQQDVRRLEKVDMELRSLLANASERVENLESKAPTTP